MTKNRAVTGDVMHLTSQGKLIQRILDLITEAILLVMWFGILPLLFGRQALELTTWSVLWVYLGIDLGLLAVRGVTVAHAFNQALYTGQTDIVAIMSRKEDGVTLYAYTQGVRAPFPMYKAMILTQTPNYMSQEELLERHPNVTLLEDDGYQIDLEE